MTGELRVLSVYEGFFTGGARILHSGVIARLHGRHGQRHSVLSIHREVRRESLRQRMSEDASCRLLRASGLDVSTLGRTGDSTSAFTANELARATAHLAEADVVISLKEQPLRLLTGAGLPRRPVVVCLHRSDPENQGPALDELLAAVAADRIDSAICCAESTRNAYQAAGVPSELLQVVPNGADLRRFRPAGAWTRGRLRRALGVGGAGTVVVFAARHDAMKNVPLFLDSARHFLRHDPTGEVLACGPGMRGANPALRAEITAAFAADQDLLPRLHLLGVRADMENVYRAADVVALTSSVGEAAPLCLIEGMLSGAVPVATDVGDCALIVTGHGLITEPDPAAIAAAWQEAALRRDEFAASLPTVADRFSHRRMVQSYARIIAGLRSQRRVSRPRPLAARLA